MSVMRHDLTKRLHILANYFGSQGHTIAAQAMDAAADRIEELEAEVQQLRFTSGCEECTRLGHHPRCDGYEPSIQELLGMGYEDGTP